MNFYLPFQTASITFLSYILFELAPLYKRRVFIYDRGNYQAFSNDLVQTDWQTLKTENINTYAENITKRITTLTNKHVPNRLIN